MEGRTVYLEPDGLQVRLYHGENLLTGLQRQVPNRVPVGCRGGGCGICKVQIRSGQVVQGTVSVTALSPEEQAQGVVLACKAEVQSDLVIQRLPAPQSQCQHCRKGGDDAAS